MGLTSPLILIHLVTSFRVDPAVLEGLLKAIRDAVSGHRREDDVALPVFVSATSDNGPEGWCHSIDELSEEFGWSSITTAARPGKPLMGSPFAWCESWNNIKPTG